MSILQHILEFDKSVFFFINNRLANPFFDFIMPYLRHANTWIPLYLFLLIFIPWKHKKNGWFWVLLAIITGACTDIVSSHIIKQNIWRIRPCGDPGLAGHVHFLLKYCPHSSSFTSSHAANHFGFATFLFLTLRKYYGRVVWLIFLWATIVCFAQIYVGVHYPIDIICGALVGSLIGLILARIFNNFWGISANMNRSTLRNRGS